MKDEFQESLSVLTSACTGMHRLLLGSHGYTEKVVWTGGDSELPFQIGIGFNQRASEKDGS